MLHLSQATTGRTMVPLVVEEPCPCVLPTSPTLASPSSYAVGPLDPASLVTWHVHLEPGEVCTLLVPTSLPLRVLHHPEFHDGYQRNYWTEEGEEDQQWMSVPHTLNLIASKLCGEGFEDPDSGEVEPDFGPWEIGWLLRDFTRLAAYDRLLALTALAHLRFLLSFLPPQPPASWPPVGLLRAHWPHNDAVKAFRERVRVYRQQGTSFDEAQRLALGEKGPAH